MRKALLDFVLEIPGAADCKCNVCGVDLEIGSWCDSCLHADRRRRASASLASSITALAGAPPWPWATVASSVFAERVRVAKFRGFAAKWTPDRGNVVLCGPSGSGKTVAMRACASRLVDEALDTCNSRHPIVRALWTSAHALLRAVREHRLGAGTPPELERAEWAPILFLDELGQEPRSEVLFEMLDTRYRGGLVTVVTTGLRVPQLTERYGDAFVRRLVERGTVVEEWPGA